MGCAPRNRGIGLEYEQTAKAIETFSQTAFDRCPCYPGASTSDEVTRAKLTPEQRSQRLMDGNQEEELRSGVSRAYYAAYATVTGRLSAADFPHGWNNPSHGQLPDLVKTASGIAPSYRSSISTKLRYLRLHRERADYKPGEAIDRATALAALKEARAIMYALGYSP